jgi:hypothetical protein
VSRGEAFSDGSTFFEAGRPEGRAVSPEISMDSVW